MLAIKDAYWRTGWVWCNVAVLALGCTRTEYYDKDFNVLPFVCTIHRRLRKSCNGEELCSSEGKAAMCICFGCCAINVATIREVQQLMQEVSYEDYVQGRVVANR